MTTATESFLSHGGRLRAAAAAFPRAPYPWIDLSTGINPCPYPAPVAGPDARSRLPDPESVAELEAAAAAAFGADPRAVAAVPGSEAGLRILPRLLGANSVAIAAPSYAGHEQAWRAAGADVAELPLAALRDCAAGAVLLVNPNNPDGRVVPAAGVMELARHRAVTGGWTIVDEAFGEVAPADCVAAQAGGRLVVLRSFGKFYGLAGLRLGFVVAEAALAAEIRAAFGDWPVSADAIVAGLAAYPDTSWAAAARSRLALDRARLDRLLQSAGLLPAGGTDLFRLVRAADAGRRFHKLAEAGVLVRPFAYQSGWLRFGLPGEEGSWLRLEAALRSSA